MGSIPTGSTIKKELSFMGSSFLILNVDYRGDRIRAAVNDDLNGRQSRERPKDGEKAKSPRLFVAVLRPIPTGSTKKENRLFGGFLFCRADVESTHFARNAQRVRLPAAEHPPAREAVARRGKRRIAPIPTLFIHHFVMIPSRLRRIPYARSACDSIQCSALMICRNKLRMIYTALAVINEP